MDPTHFPQPFVSTIGRIVDVQKTSQVIVIKDGNGNLVAAPLPTAFLGLSTWLSTSRDLIGCEVGLVSQVMVGSTPWVVLEPQMVVDVTEAAQLVTTSGIVADQVLTKRMRPPGAMSLALTGTLVNTAFDLLAQRSALSDSEIMEEALRTRPLSLAASIREGSFENVEESLRSSLPALRKMYEEFRTGTMTLEPHYISPTFGLQGRADICIRTKDMIHVVEMKAGKAASGTSVRPDHASQTSGYAALIHATEPSMHVRASVWYVQSVGHPLRNVEDTDQWLSLLLAARNVIVCENIALKNRRAEPLQQMLLPSSAIAGSSYDEHARADLASSLTRLDSTEQLIVRAWLSYAAADQEMVRIGGGSGRSMADLWRQDLSEKRKSSTVITGLSFDASASDMERMHLVFVRSSGGDCALRIGDPVILHPESAGLSRPCDGPLYKAVLRGLSANNVEVSLRNKFALEADLFSRDWILEQDVLDTSVRSYYTAIRSFIDAPPERRAVLLGRRAPRFGTVSPLHAPDLTDEQRSIVERALSAEELFLIQGPPGTGKTSAVLRTIIGELTQRPSERVLAVAYTNRAANEISSVLARHGIKHLRHGSIEGTSGESSIPLLGQHLTPHALADEIANARCIVSTVQSLYSSPEIWSFGSFTTAVIDEASQVLEPPLVGITSRVDKVILMGDHCQLPAVVTQRPEALVVRGAAFEQISMSSLGMSAFERLIRCAIQRGDQTSIAMLTMQGRMHKDVMAFVSKTFYDGLLEPIADWQSTDEPLPWSDLLPYRACFIPIDSPMDQANSEAKVLAQLATSLHLRAQGAQRELSIGIITPFRIQNNAIVGLLPANLQDVITVDTVERFQGSERDVILYGTCVGSEKELESIVSETEIGGVVIDRKLNVAMTRAREQFVLVGSPSVLRHSTTYAHAIETLQSFLTVTP